MIDEKNNVGPAIQVRVYIDNISTIDKYSTVYSSQYLTVFESNHGASQPSNLWTSGWYKKWWLQVEYE